MAKNSNKIIPPLPLLKARKLAAELNCGRMLGVRWGVDVALRYELVLRRSAETLRRVCAADRVTEAW